MKQISKFFALAVVMIAITANTFAQVSAPTTASATIVAPIAIIKNTDMNFGNVYVSATVAGTVVLAPAGTRSVTGGAGLPGVAGTVSAATFVVTGTAGATYAITLPASVTLTGPTTMTVDVFTSNPVTGLLTGGTQNLQVGATLNVAAAQATGVYTSANFNVTVNYN
jgi:hypothetical protein